MNYKAKIVQIIKYEDKKNYGFIDYPGHDYINLRPVELVKEEEKNTRSYLRRVVGYVWIAIFLIIPTNQVYLHLKYLTGFMVLLGVFSIGGGLLFSSYRHKKVFNKYWYFEAPVPVPKGHNYQVGDILNISIKLQKVDK